MIFLKIYLNLPFLTFFPWDIIDLEDIWYSPFRFNFPYLSLSTEWLCFLANAGIISQVSSGKPVTQSSTKSSVSVWVNIYHHFSREAYLISSTNRMKNQDWMKQQILRDWLRLTCIVFFLRLRNLEYHSFSCGVMQYDTSLVYNTLK